MSNFYCRRPVKTLERILDKSVKTPGSRRRIDNLVRRVEESAVIPLQIHPHPEIVQIIRPKDVYFFTPMRRFNHHADRKLLPGDAQQAVAPLADKIAYGSEQLR